MRLVVATSVLFAIASSACSKEEKKGEVRGELQTVATSSTAAGAGLHGMMEMSNVTSSNVRIESLKVPVFAMVIGGGSGGGGAVYSCSGSTSAECLVELVGTNLTDLLTNGSKGSGNIKTGTFDLVSIYHKPQGCNYADEASKSQPDPAATFRASGVLNGVTYYTNKALGLSTTGPAEDVSFGFGACASNSRVVGEIRDGETVTVRSFVDLQYLAFISTHVPSGSTLGSKNPSLGVDMSMSAFNIASTIGDGVPRVERYILSLGDSGYGCGGFMSLFSDSANNPFGGYMRTYAYEGQTCPEKLEVATGGNLAQTTLNADGTLYIRDTTPDLPPGNVFENFQRKAHSGTVKSRKIVGTELQDKAYTARPL